MAMSAATFAPQQTQGFVLCCLCGTNIMPNPSNMCVNCIRSQVDITEGIQKQATVLWCKECGRYLQPPKHWLRAELESKELLTFCVKKLKGLNKVHLVDAGFIWTEPHSMRLKVKLTIQAEVFNGTKLQQSFVVEYVVEKHMCPDCNRANANPNSWIACAQLRQHVHHKRTFFYLEQLILKHGAADSCVKILDIHEGVDFYYSSRAHALKFMDFLQSVVPIRFRHDKQLVSHNTHDNTYNYKYTFSIEIAPVCRDDLIYLSKTLSKSLGNFGPLVLCTRVTNQITLVDPVTLRTVHMDSTRYWHDPFKAAISQRALIEYIVLDIEPVTGSNNTHKKWTLAEAQVARKSDFGRNDTMFIVRTHLGHLLKPGDTALGYDVGTAQLDGKDDRTPDVVLVRKSYEEKRRRRRDKGMPERVWKLRHLGMEVEGDAGQGTARGRGGAVDLQAQERERERFLEELEEDPELRKNINIYKDEEALARAQQAAAQGATARPAGLDDMEDDDEDDEDDLPQVPLEELLDDLAGLGLEEEGDEGQDMDEDMEDA